jgi:hypothetical protein
VHRDGREEAHGNEERNLGCHRDRVYMSCFFFCLGSGAMGCRRG